MSRNRSQRTASAQIGAFLLLLGFLTGAVGAAAADFEVPPLRSAVTDQAGMLSPATRERLESALRRLEASGGTQLAILTVPNLAGSCSSLPATNDAFGSRWARGSRGS